MSELTPPRVSFGIPVYRGVGLVEDTLTQIAAQTFTDFEALISVDGDDLESAEACRPFVEADPRFRMEIQADRLGWSGNIAWTIRNRRGRDFVYLQQDDGVTPNYLEALVAAADRHPQASIVYSEMSVYGSETCMVRHEPIIGDQTTRVLCHLERMDTSMFRGLIRGFALAQIAGPRSNDDVESFGADLGLLAEAAAAGEMLRVEGATYFKRLHDRGTHLRWYHWPSAKKREAWVSLGAWMAAAIVPVGLNPSDCRRLLMATLDRFAVCGGGSRWMFCEINDTDPAVRVDIASAILDRVFAEGLLDLPSLLLLDRHEIEMCVRFAFST